MPCTSRSWTVRDAWRKRRKEARHDVAGTGEALRPIPLLRDVMKRARLGCNALTYAESLDEFTAGLIANVLYKARNGLPRLAPWLVGGRRPIDADDTLRVCYLGGSVSEQKVGYRPRVTSWIGTHCSASHSKVEEVPAFCGNCGSKVLAYMVSEWVVSRRPHLVFIELAINDGDTLLETNDPDSLGADAHLDRRSPCGLI